MIERKLPAVRHRRCHGNRRSHSAGARHGRATGRRRGGAGRVTGPSPQDAAPTATPIKHLVVLFDENVSFDHYFATYPKAANPPGEPAFTALPGTPAVNNLANAHLLTNNPNFTNTANGDRRRRPVPARSHAGQHRRPEPRLHGRAAGL